MKAQIRNLPISILLILINCSIILTESNNSEFLIKPFNGEGLQSNITVYYKGQELKLQDNEDWIFSTILDYANISHLMIKEVYQPSFLPNPFENINGSINKHEDDDQVEVYFNLYPPINPCIFKDKNHDYLKNRKKEDREQLILEVLQQQNDEYEDNLYKQTYFDQIRNQCFLQSSHFFYVFIPISQINEQKIVDQIIQNLNNMQKNKKEIQLYVLHYLEGVYTKEEFEAVKEITRSEKYPLTLRKRDVGFQEDGSEKKSIETYIDQRNKNVLHFFLYDIKLKEFEENNKLIFEYIQNMKVMKASLDFIHVFLSCLNEEVPNYFEIETKQVQNDNIKQDLNQNTKKNYYVLEGDSIIFQSNLYEIGQLKKKEFSHKYILKESVKQEGGSDIYIYDIKLFLPGYLKIISYEVKHGINNTYLQIETKNSIQEYDLQDEQPEVCDYKIEKSNIKEDIETIKIVMKGNSMQSNLINEMKMEELPNGVYRFIVKTMEA